MQYVSSQCTCQGKLLDEARRDLEALKKAHYKAERDMCNLEERFEREMRTANHEIRQLRVRIFHIQIVLVNDDAAVFMVTHTFPPSNQAVVPERRSMGQQIPSAVPVDILRHATVLGGVETA